MNSLQHMTDTAPVIEVSSPSKVELNAGAAQKKKSLAELEHRLREAESLFAEHGDTSGDGVFSLSPEQLDCIVDPKNPFMLKAMGGLSEFFRRLGSDPHQGLVDAQLSEAELRHREQRYGRNEIPQKDLDGFFKIVMMTLDDKVLIVLVIAAIIALSLGIYEAVGEYHPPGSPPSVDWVEGVAILVAVIVVTLVGSVNDWQKERQFAKLNRKKEDRLLEVLRNGLNCQINIHDVEVGDLIVVQPGDILSVDGVLLQSNDVQCDESSVTGESDNLSKVSAAHALDLMDKGEVEAKQLDFVMISGSKVMQGSGLYMATSVGENSMYGRTLMSLQQGAEVTPLQEKLNRIADGIAVFGVWSAVILFIVLFIRFCVRVTTGHYLVSLPEGVMYADQATSAQKGNLFMDIFIIAVTIIVVAVPEGLPLAVTLALAFATKRMIKDNCLVRVLKSCETMGNATTVCSDKTGTLTENKMTVVASTIGDETWNEGNESTPDFSHEDLREVTADSICLNSSVYEQVNDPDVLAGSKTEMALVGFARRFLDVSTGSLKSYRDSRSILFVLPFDSARKYMVTIVKHEDRYRLLVKGAAEIILRASAKLKDTDRALTSDTRQFLSQQLGKYADDALRVIGVGYKDFHSSKPVEQFTPDDIDISDLTFLGLFGIKDPLRAGVAHAVGQCLKAGVCVRMVTGDNVRTARAIAINAGIINAEDGKSQVFEGPEFRKLSGTEMASVVPQLRVLARSSPEDKRRLVEFLKLQGETVAVTGDGTNDAPALKLADVGFSMGISGTEVAKEASDIIIMDDNFSSIVNAMMWGRTVNDAVKKFLQFQLTVNVTAVALTFISAVASRFNESVMTSVQLLWVNLIMDTLAALALATDAPTEECLNRKPDSRKVSLITPTMWKMIFGQTVYQLCVTFVLHFAGRQLFNYPSSADDYASYLTEDQRNKLYDTDNDVLTAMVFNVFVWMQFFNMFVNRRIDNGMNLLVGVHRNLFFPLIAIIIGGVEVIIMFVGGQVFSVSCFNSCTVKGFGKKDNHKLGAMWATAIICGFVSIPVAMLIRLVPDSWFMALCPKPVINFSLWGIEKVNRAVVWLLTPFGWMYNGIVYACFWTFYKVQGKNPPPKEHNEEDFEDDYEKHPQYEYVWAPGIEKSLDELQLIQRLRGGRLRQLFPIHKSKRRVVQRRKPSMSYLRPSQDSLGRDSRSSSLTALMAPIVVSGAVGGWNPTLVEHEK